MSSTLTPQEFSARLFDGYAAPAGYYDELFSAPGVLRPHWAKFSQALRERTFDDLTSHWERARRLVDEGGIIYGPLNDEGRAHRPWELDALPLVIPSTEWQTLTAGLVQRARLLNLILADLYGPQTLLSRGLVPPALVYANPGFERAFHGQAPPGESFLVFYVADLARAPSGQWWVVADRTDAPMGAGYALENRIVMSRSFPGAFRESHVERLAGFFLTARETMQKLAPAHRDNPRIVSLSEGPGGASYFEDTYLSRYLGYTLAEGGDLAVRSERVMLKTLGGLMPVDVVLRRLSDHQSDPLELRSDPSRGVAGLLQAARQGNVAVTSAPGSSLVESPAFMAFVPRLCQELLGEVPLVPTLATWWCGQPEGLKYVLENLEGLEIKAAFRRDRRGAGVSRDQLHGVAGWKTCPARRDELAALLRARPELFVGQENVAPSCVPVWRTESGLSAAHVTLRSYLVASEDTFVAMPGGLARVAEAGTALQHSMFAGDGCKDVWITSGDPVREVSLLRPPGESIQLRRSGADLPSRVADNLFWLGRHVERAEGAARLLRTILARLTGEAESQTLLELPMLLHALARQGQIEPGFAVEGIRDPLPAIEQVLPAAVLDSEQPGSLRSTVMEMYRLAAGLRDRISLDCWRIINRIDHGMQRPVRRDQTNLSDVLSAINEMLIDLAAFGGLVTESMTRTPGWRFLDMGRRIERSHYTIGLVQSMLAAMQAGGVAVLEAALEVADSSMTYRSRYLASLQTTPVLDLLLTDETNPRSLAYQLVALDEHVEHLPRDREQPLLGPEQRIAKAALNSVRMVDLNVISARKQGAERSHLDRLLARLADQLPRLSEMISHKYLVHSGVPRQLAAEAHGGQVF